MKGYAELVLAAVILLVLAVGFVGNFYFKSANREIDEESGLEIGCRTEDDCVDNPDGSECIIVYPEGSSLVCGCIFNEHCVGKRSGFCGSQNECV